MRREMPVALVFEDKKRSWLWIPGSSLRDAPE
jgi:hypothetical protein